MRSTLFLLPLAACATAQAAVFVDVGSSANQTSNPGSTTPAHVEGLAGATETTWNTLTADSSSLADSLGNTAAGVSVDFGTESTSNAITWSNALPGLQNNSDRGGVYNNFVYDDASRAGTNGVDLAARISGLAAGEYAVLILSSPNTGSVVTDRPDTNRPAWSGYAFADSAGGATTSIGTYTSSFVTAVNNFNTGGNTTLDAGEEYLRFDVTISGPSDYIVLVGSGDRNIANPNQQKFSFVGFQVTLVPEPATLGLFAAVGCLARRRRG